MDKNDLDKHEFGMTIRVPYNNLFYALVEPLLAISTLIRMTSGADVEFFVPKEEDLGPCDFQPKTPEQEEMKEALVSFCEKIGEETKDIIKLIEKAFESNTEPSIKIADLVKDIVGPDLDKQIAFIECPLEQFGGLTLTNLIAAHRLDEVIEFLTFYKDDGD